MLRRPWLLGLVLLLPVAGSAQEVVLDFTPTLARGATGQHRWNFVSRAEDGHYFVIPTTEGVWAEFTGDGELVGFFGERGFDGAPNQFRRAERVLPLGGDTLLVADMRRIVWTTRDVEYLAARVINFTVDDLFRLEDGSVVAMGSRHPDRLNWVRLGGPGEVLEEGEWVSGWEVTFNEHGAPTTPLHVSSPTVVSEDVVWLREVHAFINFRTGEVTEIKGLGDDDYEFVQDGDNVVLVGRTWAEVFRLEGDQAVPADVSLPDRWTFRVVGDPTRVYQWLETEWNELRAIEIHRVGAVAR